MARISEVKVGNIYGILTVVSEIKHSVISGNNRYHVDVLCERCGRITQVRLDCLDRTERKSCGKCHTLIDNRSKEPLYNVYTTMKQRCFDPRHPRFSRYGGRGITVCEEWLKSYPAFRSWSMKNGYFKGLQIDRINNDGNYEPNNCRWVTRLENARNK